jgi:outer membrane receptor protein involved in Fe transport
MKNISAISNLKLRVGYGTSGNQTVKIYGSKGSITTNPLYYEFGTTEAVNLGFRTGYLENPDLKWETTNTANLGLDFGLLENRIQGSFELYKAHTSGILQQVILPPTSAVTYVNENIGETESKGIEATLSTVNISTSDIKWTTDLTFSANREKITFLADGVQQDVVNGWFVGSPLEVHYDWKKTGIWQTSEAAQATLYGKVPGDIKVEDVVFDSTINI